MVKYLAKGYLWALLLLLYSPILIIMIFSFTEAKVLGNWTGFSTKLYSSLLPATYNIRWSAHFGIRSLSP